MYVSKILETSSDLFPLDGCCNPRRIDLRNGRVNVFILTLVIVVSSSASAPSVKEELLCSDIASLFGIVSTNNIRLGYILKL